MDHSIYQETNPVCPEKQAIQLMLVNENHKDM